MIRRTVAGALAGILVAAPAAAAHVTLQPKELPAGQYTRVDVRVPNERDDAGTRKVVVQFPPGFASASYEPKPGWKVDVQRRKATEPIELHGEQVDEEIDTITWTAQDATAIPPGAFQDFGLSVRMPEAAAGTKLTFKATQTYAGGEVVRWIGPEDADEPAPVVTLTAAVGDAASQPAAAPAPVVADDPEDGDGDGLAIAALIVGGLGLAAGGTALATGRRRTA